MQELLRTGLTLYAMPFSLLQTRRMSADNILGGAVVAAREQQQHCLSHNRKDDGISFAVINEVNPIH